MSLSFIIFYYPESIFFLHISFTLVYNLIYFVCLILLLIIMIVFDCFLLFFIIMTILLWLTGFILFFGFSFVISIVFNFKYSFLLIDLGFYVIFRVINFFFLLFMHYSFLFSIESVKFDHLYTSQHLLILKPF